MDDTPQMPPYKPTDLLCVTLEAQEWNVVFAALLEMPMRVSRPVYDKILNQSMQRQEQVE